MEMNKIDISPFIVMDIMQRAAEREKRGLPVYHMEVGQPSFKAPPKVFEVAHTILNNNNIGYTTALGIDELRQRISLHYEDFYNIKVPWEQIIITTGASGGLVLAMLACFKPGSNVGVPVPGYPCYRNKLNALNLNVINIQTSEEEDFLPTIKQLENLKQPLHGLIITSPSNPTGSILNHDQLMELSNYCHTKGIWLFSDEIYHGIVFENFAPTIWGMCDSAIVVNSFSKYFCMTGWRLGWMIVPKNLVRTIEMLSQNFYMSPPTVSQFAALSAFEDYKLLDKQVNFYKRNRDELLTGLKSLGFNEIIKPAGAFYAYVKASHLTNNSLKFCVDLLEKTGLAITPGLDFDQNTGHEWIRFSFTRGDETVKNALECLEYYLNTVGKRRYAS